MIVCNLFSQMGIEFILNHLPSGRTPYQGQIHQQQESDNCVSTANSWKNSFSQPMIFSKKSYGR
jgi:hypothetical protein